SRCKRRRRLRLPQRGEWSSDRQSRPRVLSLDYGRIIKIQRDEHLLELLVGQGVGDPVELAGQIVFYQRENHPGLIDRILNSCFTHNFAAATLSLPVILRIQMPTPARIPVANRTQPRKKWIRYH